MATNPTDFLSGLGGLQSMPGSYQIQQAVALDKLRQQLGQQQVQAGQQALAANQLKADEQAQFKIDAQAYAANPTANGAATLLAKYPDQQKAISDSWKTKDEATRQADLRQIGAVHSYLANGKVDAAIEEMQSRINAERAAGQDVTDDERLIARLKSDPSTAKAVQAQLALQLASVVPEKFGGVVEQLNKGSDGYTLAPGSKRYGSDNQLVAEAPFAPEYRNVGAGDTLVQVGGGEPAPSGSGQQFTGGWTPRQRNGGDNPDQAVDNKITGVAKALGVDPDADISTLSPATIAKALAFGEGGAGTLADRNNNPTNLRSATDGTYRKFPNADAAITAAASQVKRNLGRGQTTVRQMIEGLPTGGAQAAGSRVIAQGAPKPGYAILSPQEITQIPGLDPNKAYQKSPDGQITAIGGNDKGQLKPLPPKALDVLATNKASLQNIDQAITLLDPKNQSPAAKAARYSIGSSNYMLPNAIVQRTNPEGNDFRAQLGQIGGIIIKDTSGAAVSASEDNRLAKWVPKDTDTPDGALSKLRNLRREIMQRSDAVRETYSEEQGYRAYNGDGGSPIKITGAQEYHSLPKGTTYIDPNGVKRVKR